MTSFKERSGLSFLEERRWESSPTLLRPFSPLVQDIWKSSRLLHTLPSRASPTGGSRAPGARAPPPGSSASRKPGRRERSARSFWKAGLAGLAARAPRPAQSVLSRWTSRLYTCRGLIPRPWWVKRGSQGPASAVAAGTGRTRSASALLRRPICSPLPCRRPLALRPSGLGGRWLLLRLETPSFLSPSLLLFISVRASFMAFGPALFKPSRPCPRHFWTEPPVPSVFPFYPALHVGQPRSDGSLSTPCSFKIGLHLGLEPTGRVEDRGLPDLCCGRKVAVACLLVALGVGRGEQGGRGPSAMVFPFFC